MTDCILPAFSIAGKQKPFEAGSFLTFNSKQNLAELFLYFILHNLFSQLRGKPQRQKQMSGFIYNDKGHYQRYLFVVAFIGINNRNRPP
jgi:hypothetical protein